MRKSKLGIQALSPDGKALEWVKEVKPRIFKAVIVGAGDFVGWMPQIPEETFVVGRYFGDGNIDYLPWTAANAVILADRIKLVHDMNHSRVDAWEGINEPVVHTVGAMQQLAEFQRVWALEMRAKGLSPIVGNFSVGNPPVEEWNGTNLMEHFRPALEVGDRFGYHGYGCPQVLSDSPFLALRYRRLFVEAGIERPVILTEFGVDCGSKGHGYKERWSDEHYVAQLMAADQVLQADPLVHSAAIYCYGAWGWKTFDLTRNAAGLLGEYIISQGDIPEYVDEEEEEPVDFNVEKCGEWLRNELWNEQGVPYNPAAAFPARARVLGWGRPLAPEGRRQWHNHVIAYQPFALGFLFCREGDWSNIQAWRW